MSEIRCAIELREDEDRQSPGRIIGTLMRYGARAGDRPERFAEGALSWKNGGIILNQSNTTERQPIMRFTPTVEGSEVRIDAALPDTSRGRDAAVMIRNGTLTGLSVEFKPTSEGRAGGVREIRAAKLTAAGLVDDPSYPSASVEVRAGGNRRPRIWL